MPGHITVNKILRNNHKWTRKYVCTKVCKSCYISCVHLFF